MHLRHFKIQVAGQFPIYATNQELASYRWGADATATLRSTDAGWPHLPAAARVALRATRPIPCFVRGAPPDAAETSPPVLLQTSPRWLLPLACPTARSNSSPARIPGSPWSSRWRAADPKARQHTTPPAPEPSLS